MGEHKYVLTTSSAENDLSEVADVILTVNVKYYGFLIYTQLVIDSLFTNSTNGCYWPIVPRAVLQLLL